MTFQGTTILVMMLVGVSFGAEPVRIETAHHSPKELATKVELEKLIRTGLELWTSTHLVIIDETAIPHSHPVLTLHTRHLGDDDGLLSAYVHEQLHWFLEKKKSETAAAVERLKVLYPHVPVGYPDGAENEQSTYEHLIVCFDEEQADRVLLGPERAKSVMKASSKDHYRWIYDTVLRDEERLDVVVNAHHLNPMN